jgi:hypothetical protein
MLKTFTSCLLALGATSLAGVIAPAQAFAPLSLTKTFNNPTPEHGDQFGNSVSLSGTLALIGAPSDDTGAANAGSAYLFNTTTGNLLKTFNNPTPEDDDSFGNSVSLSGTSALIGAPFDNTGAQYAGSAYLFDATTGTLLKTFNNPTPAISDSFGYSVSLSGTLALIGAPYDNTSASDEGSAYLFDTTTGNLLKTFNNPSPQLSDNFGYSVSLSGTSALIGAYGDNTGASGAGSAYLFNTTTGNLLQTFNNPSPQLSDNFGYSVSLSGISALIGAPYDNTSASDAGSAYLYQTVPEPSFTILGTGVVLGALPLLKKGKKTKDKDA